MKKKFFVFMFVVLFFGGCLQTKEELTLNLDGSGKLETEIVVPEGTVSLIDMLMGGFMQVMSEAFSPEGQEMAEGFAFEMEGMPENFGFFESESMAEEMFANKEEIIRKADSAGLEIKFLDFHKERKNGDLYVQYAMKFDDIKKLINSNIIMTGINLSRDFEDNIILALEVDEQQKKEVTAQKKQTEDFLASEEFKELNSATQGELIEALSFMRFEFKVTAPGEIIDTKGFRKDGQKTAVVSFEGNMLDDPQLWENFYRIDNSVTFGAQGTTFLAAGESVASSDAVEPLPFTGPEELSSALDTKEDVYPDVGSLVKIYLSGGRTAEGRILEKTDNYLRISMHEVALTYYFDDIERVEEK